MEANNAIMVVIVRVVAGMLAFCLVFFTILGASDGGQAFQLPHHRRHDDPGALRSRIRPCGGQLLPYSTQSTMKSTPILEGGGMPSHPGWRSNRLNRLTKWADSRYAQRTEDTSTS